MFEITIALEIIAFIIGLICFKVIKPTIYRLVILMLFATVVNECCVRFNIYASIGINKIQCYNIFFQFQYIILAIIYVANLKQGKVSIGIAIFFLILSTFFLIKGGLSNISPNYISVICISLLVLPFLYLYELYAYSNLLNLKKDSLFFFSIGLITAQFLLLLYINARRIDDFVHDKYWLTIFKSLNTAGNIIYYSLIIYSYKCSFIFLRRVGT